jgi:glucan phosphoethanolaminetransferase (alkaline phosphatase superfamily)
MENFFTWPLWLLLAPVYLFVEVATALFEALLPYLPLLILVIALVGLICALIVIFTVGIAAREIRRAMRPRVRPASAPVPRV